MTIAPRERWPCVSEGPNASLQEGDGVVSREQIRKLEVFAGRRRSTLEGFGAGALVGLVAATGCFGELGCSDELRAARSFGEAAQIVLGGAAIGAAETFAGT